MATADNRIVSMQFDNEEFEKRLQTTLQGLDKLNETIQMAGAKQGLTEVSKAADSVNLSSMSSSLDNISGKFSIMGAIGFSAIQKVTQGVLGLVTSLAQTAKTDILDPIITGGKSRATALEQAKFQFQGLGIDVNKGMASALAAVKGTAFGLDEAATVAAQFGASGIQAGDDMTKALTGISGIAAMTGRSFSEIGQIFTSAAGQGKVTNMDLQEFAIRGLNAAAAYAKQTGMTEAQVHAMATAGTLDFKSFADAMDKAFGAHATAANQTYTGSVSNMHAALSRLGASFLSTNIDQQRDVFNALTPVIDNFTTALKPVTTEVLKLSAAGSEKLVKFLNSVDFTPFSRALTNAAGALANAAKLVGTFLGVIKDSFHAVFPPNLTNDLDGVTYFFEHLFKILEPGPATIEKLKTIFTGLFATFSIVSDVLKGVLTVVLSFFGAFLGPSSHGAMSALTTIAGAMEYLNKTFVESGRIDAFFDKLAADVKKPVEFLERLIGDIKNLFTTTANSGAASKSLDKVGNSLDNLSGTADKIRGVLHDVVGYLDTAWQKISTWFSQLGQKISASFNPDQFRSALSVVNTALLGGLGLMLKQFIDKGFKFDIGGGVFGQLTTGLHSVNQTLKLMQTDLKAKTLMEIAGAIGILAASIVVLSMIKPQALQQAMTALAFGFTQLVIVMKLLDTIGTGIGGASKLALVGTAMTVMSGSVLILATAIRILSGLGVGALATGLTGVGVAMGILIGAATLMEGSSAGMIAAGLAMNAMATGLVVMAGAVKLFATMSWAEMAKGLVGIAGALVIIAVTMSAMPIGQTLAAGLAMIPLSIGITILAGAVKLFGTMSWAELAKGLVGLAGGLLIIAVAMSAMPLTLPLTAAGLILVALAIGLMVPSIKMIGNMDFVSLVKGLGGLALMLGILAIGVNLMDGALPGAAALIVVSGALVVLTMVLKELGDLSWSQLIMGLVAIAAVLVVLGLAAGVLEPLIPALLGLGLALTLVGAGFALFGAGAFLVATAFSIMAVAGAAGAAAIVAALVTLIKAIPTFVTGLIKSLSQSAAELVKGSSTFLGLFGTLLVQLMDVIVKAAPAIAAAIVAIITSALALIRLKFPDVMQTAFDLLMSFLTSLDNNLPKVIDEATKVIVSFTTGLANNAPAIVSSAVNMIGSFLAAIGTRAGDLVTAGIAVLVSFLNGIASNLDKVAKAAVNVITSFVGAVAGSYLQIISAGVDLIVQFVLGIGKNIDKVITAATSVAIAFVTEIGKNAIKFIDAAAAALVAFLNGLAAAINTYAPQLRAAGVSIIGAIINGLTFGLADKWGAFVKMIMDKAKSLVKDILGFFGISSPSKVFMEIGKNLGLGLSAGIDNDTTATNSAVAQAEKIVKAFSDSLGNIPDSLSGMDEFNPVISPVLDLTRVKAAASGLGDLIPSPSITADLSYNQARTIASTADVAKTNQLPPVEPKEVTFNQTINAPSALSTNDIYKGTKSQLAQAKEELNIS